MKYGVMTIEITGHNPEVWYVLIAFLLIMIAFVVLLFKLLPHRRKWLVVTVPVLGLVITPPLIRKVIEHVLSDPDHGLLACAHFFDIPRYYPSAIALLTAIIMLKHGKGHAVAQQVTPPDSARGSSGTPLAES